MTETPSQQDAVTAAVERYRAATDAVHVAADDPGTAIVPASGTDHAAAMKQGLVQKRASLLRAQQEAETARADLRAAIDQQKSAVEAQMRALQAELAPALKKAKLLGDGIDALNIYLGRDEEIHTIREGERAPADTVITVRQRVLSMAEESLIAVDAAGMDFNDIDRFCQWLVADDSHLEQVIPEAKGVVAIVARHDARDYGNPWETQAKNEANQQTHWLIRNGEALWLTTTEFVVGKTTVPRAKDFTSLFERRGFRGEVTPLEPGTPEWSKAEETADARTRHYMKVALLLQGLLDRTAVFQPHAGSSFLDQRDYEAGLVRVITDAENELGTGRPSFAEWQRDLMRRAEVGMRVVGAFAQRMATYDGRDSRADVHPKGATPRDHEAYVLQRTERPYSDFQFVFDRADQVWVVDRYNYGSRPAKRRATGYLSRSDQWVLPLDLLDVGDLDYYLNSRSERHNYLTMIPTLRAAQAVLAAEAAEEAPFRSALVGRLMSAGHPNPGGSADDLIRWFKTGNRIHRPLASTDEKAARMILAEAARRRSIGAADSEMSGRLRQEHPCAILVARRTNDWIVVEPQERRYTAAAAGNVYATVHVHGLRGGLKESKVWQTLRRSQLSRWTIAWQSEAWDDWNLDPRGIDFPTDDDLDALIEKIRAAEPNTFQIRIEPNPDPHEYGDRIAYWTDAGDGVHHGTAGLIADGRNVGFRVRRPRPVDDGRDQPHWETRWSGTPHPDRVAWSDPDRLGDVRTRWRVRRDAAAAQRARHDALLARARQIHRAWEQAALEGMRLRFIEDFGDPTLWEGHRKSIQAPRYPHRDFQGPHHRGEKVSGLIDVIEAAAKARLDLSGVSVAEAAKAVGVDPSSLPEDLHELRWPASE